MNRLIIIIPIFLLLLGGFLFKSYQFEKINKADEIALYQCTSQFPLTFSTKDSITGLLKHNKIPYYKYSRKANFEELDLFEIPTDIFKNTPCVEQVAFNHNKLSTIPIAIEDLPNLKELNCIKNKITTVSDTAFEQNEFLETILLNYNSLTTLNLNTFYPIDAIYLSHNKIQQILPITNLTFNAIHYLDLSYNQLTTLDLNMVKSVVEMKVNNNRINKILPITNNYQSIFIRKLDLGDNNLKHFPSNIVLFKNLEQLNLKGNKIQSDQYFAKTTFEQLESLTTIDLSDNELTSFPTELGKAPYLAEVNLQGNQISGLAVFKGFNRLRSLTIENQMIENFSIEKASFAEVSRLNLNSNSILNFEIKEENNQLYRLHLDTNQLSSLPQSINQLKNLTYLHLSKNKIKTFPDIRSLNQLKELDLSDNQLKNLDTKGKLPPYTIDNAMHFILNLSHNPITVLDFDQINDSVTKLYLSYTNIQTIKNLKELPRLKELHLNGNNNLEDFPLDIFDYLTDLEVLDLSYTKIDKATITQLIKLANENNIELKTIKTEFN